MSHVVGSWVQNGSGVALAAAEGFERLTAVVGRLAGSRSVTEVYDHILDELVAGIGASSAAVTILDETGGHLHLRAGRGLHPDASASFPLSLDVVVPVTEAVTTGIPVWVDSRAARDRWYPIVVGSDAAVVSTAAVPMRSGDQQIGVLVAGYQHDHRFLETERVYCNALADACSLALGRFPPVAPT